MRLFQAAEVLAIGPASAEVRAALVDEAVRFLRAGGVVSLEEWSSLGSDEKDAMEAAANVVEVARVTRLVTALSGPEGLASVMADVDGGASSADLLCRRAAAGAASSGRFQVGEGT